MQIHFESMAADRVGVNAAIVLQMIAEQCHINALLDPKHEAESFRLRATLESMHSLLPFLSIRMIRTATDTLEEGIYIYKTVSQNSTDRTATYRPTATGCELTGIAPPAALPTDKGSRQSTPASKKKKPVYDHDSNPYRGAAFLDNEVHRNFPCLPPTPESQLQSWADSFRLLHERDGYEYPQIYEVMNWATHNSFWRTNIRSGTSLRKHMQDLIVRMTNEHDNEYNRQ